MGTATSRRAVNRLLSLDEKHAEPITFLSVNKSPLYFIPEQLIEMNLSSALERKKPLARNEVKLSITAHRRQIRKTKSGGRVVKHEGFQSPFFCSWKAARSFEKGVSSKQTPVTLPILLPIKIYWKHPGNTAQLISSQLACQKQANTAITGIKRILPLPFEFITAI